MKRSVLLNVAGLLGLALLAPALHAQSYVHLTDVPDYDWHAGCFGTASGNLMGYWDRHGLPDFYTGPTGGGLAPLNSFGANNGIRSLWVSKAGIDGRPANMPGHMDDYYDDYESIAQDRYITIGRKEHIADCVGDFIGLNQRKWTGQLMNGECVGNIDAYSFVFWDANGDRRINFTPTNAAGAWHPDIQSGYKAWTRFRGYDAEVFTQLNDHRVGGGRGFTYESLKAEIDAGYPVLFFLQPVNESYRTSIPNITPPGNTNKYNPAIHGVMAYGYIENVPELGATKGVLLRTSWASGDFNNLVEWDTSWLGLWPARGAIGYHPMPKLKSVTRNGGEVTISWDGPSSNLYNVLSGETTLTHRYQLERATTLSPSNFSPVGSPTTERSVTVQDCCVGDNAFYRVVLLGSPP